MKIYISGKITGLDINVAAGYFEAVETQLAAAGMSPVNPMKIMPFNPNHTWIDYMKEDLGVLLACDAIFMLENWQESKGARVEYAVAKEMGLKVFYSKNHNFF